ncbi:hypothetical protein D3C78_1044240 [compost metagenome]
MAKERKADAFLRRECCGQIALRIGLLIVAGKDQQVDVEMAAILVGGLRLDVFACKPDRLLQPVIIEKAGNVVAQRHADILCGSAEDRDAAAGGIMVSAMRWKLVETSSSWKCG